MGSPSKQFEGAGLDNVIEPHRAICSDEMHETAEPEAFQQRLWSMFAHGFGSAMTLPQLDRVRWILFPEVRVPTQDTLFDDTAPDTDLPSVMQVMDLQQEQLARSLGEGHRVIHGVSGSGKTRILAYRAEYLVKAGTATRSKPVLALCFNEPLGVKLNALFSARGLADRVHARNFHKWCRQQLVAFGQHVPPQGPKMFEAMVANVIRAVERGHIPSGQYQAVLIAADLLKPEDKDDDGIPLLRPIGCGRQGEAPLVIRLPSLRDEAFKIAELFAAAHQEGHAWGDMAVLCRDYPAMDACAAALRHQRLPHQVRKRSGDFQPADDVIKVLTMRVSKGLEFPVVALPGLGQMPAAGEDVVEEARLFCVAATRATSKLIVTVSGDGAFGQRLGV